MIDEKIINSGSDFISRSDSWGVTGVTVFFVLVMVGVLVFFAVYVVKNISKVVENNTDALNKNLDKTDREFDEVKHKQNEIHADVKEILHNTKKS
ncbi:hypothetical protein [Campylobacter corcagiensis]|uniref:Uncharacterized protein n=1 Tax=Campylobacter corcagiensis TaxID=1448857 RepID=A0A7M1LID8_9BACT|nr:hypothetical protein [Campylobacter corcagiensis]QKF64560.1 hypothetical protein CCORG_0699 [Campylobacter corcagiensis]QOQ87265.1 hypothetical protein IMC76_08675 [Campylobacter corcagiensis]